MRIVWTSCVFVAGVGAAILFDVAPGYAVPTSVFLLTGLSLVVATLALSLVRRRAAVALLCLVFMIGCWRGSDAITSIEQQDRSTAPSILRSLDGLRLSVASSLDEHIGSDKSGLPKALLIGDRSGISYAITDDFRSAGLSHLLAISGLHVSLVGGTATLVAVFSFGRRRYVHLSLPLVAVLLYAALAGFAPPITRAATMFSVFILGRFMGRGSHTLAALSLAAMLMVAVQPEILTSLSFQLSFTAMLGISFLFPALTWNTEITGSRQPASERKSWARRVRRFVIGSLAVSVASTLGTLPLVALHFDAVPVWGPIATLLAVPAMPLLIVLSGFTAVLGLLPIPLLAEVSAFPVKAGVWYLESVASALGHLPPHPYDTGGWTVWMTVAYYSIAATFIAFRSRIADWLEFIRQRLMPSNRGNAIVTNHNQNAYLAASTVLLLIGIGFWGSLFAQHEPKSYMSARFLETTHGESIFIETRNGNRMLVDGGGSRTQVADQLTALLPFWDREIDVVLLTHPDADHVGGLAEVLNRFSVGVVIQSGVSSSDHAPPDWKAAIEHHDNVAVARPGMVIGLDEDVSIEVLSAGCAPDVADCEDDNDASIVTRVDVGDVSFLLTGDIERSAEIRLATSNANLRATVLKAAHHGSKTSSTTYFVDAVQPSAVVIGAGSQNRFGHPHEEVLKRLTTAVGADRVFRTDQLGTVELRTDGERLWMMR